MHLPPNTQSAADNPIIQDIIIHNTQFPQFYHESALMVAREKGEWRAYAVPTGMARCQYGSMRENDTESATTIWLSTLRPTLPGLNNSPVSSELDVKTPHLNLEWIPDKNKIRIGVRITLQYTSSIDVCVYIYLYIFLSFFRSVWVRVDVRVVFFYPYSLAGLQFLS